jgi:transcriptional regulator with XRE-family HTH domain
MICSSTHHLRFRNQKINPILRIFAQDVAVIFADNANMVGKATTTAANHLRAWRELRRMTQSQLAEAAGTSPSVISQLESGERGLSSKWLRALAPLLGTTPGFLLDHDPNDLDTAYLEAAMAVPPERREQALQILKTFRGGSKV